MNKLLVGDGEQISIKTTIEFAEWIGKNGYKIDNEDFRWFSEPEFIKTQKDYSGIELFKRFLKTKKNNE